MKRCLLCSKEIYPYEEYHFFGSDLDDEAIRAHDAHIVLDPHRWVELARQLGPSRAGVPVVEE